MKFGDTFTLLMSIEDASNIGGGPSAAPPAPVASEPAPPDSEAAIIADLHQHYEQATAPPAAPQPAPAEAPATPDPATAPTPPLPTPPEVPTEAAPVEDTVIPAPESHLAPLFSLATLPSEEALPKAIDIIQSLGDRVDPRTGQTIPGYDPIAHKLIVNSVYQAMPDTFKAWVLGDLGVKPEQVAQFQGWLANGGPQAPPLGAFPEPDANGWVMMPNGEHLDTTVPAEKERYDVQRQLHELRTEREQEKAAQRTAEEQREAGEVKRRADEQYQLEQTRANAYINGDPAKGIAGRYTLRDQMIDETVKALAPEDKILGDMFRAYVINHVDNHPDMLKIGAEATPHVLVGTGRVKEFATRQDAIIRKEINALREAFNVNVILRLNRAEKAAIATTPQSTPGMRTVESIAPPNPDEREPETWAEIRARGQQLDRQEAARRAQQRATV